MKNSNTTTATGSAKFSVMPLDLDGLHVRITPKTSKMGPIPSINTMPGNAPIVIKSSGRALCDVIGTCGNHCADCFGKYCYIEKLLKFRQGATMAYAANTRILREDHARFEKEATAQFVASCASVGRWHVSGEVESLDHLRIIYRVCDNCAAVGMQFGIYTRAINLVEQLHDDGTPIPSNLCVNRSMDNPPTAEEIARAEKYGYQFFALDKRDGQVDDNAPHCPACPADGGHGVTCAQCRKCYKCKPGRVTFEYLRN